MPQWQHTLYSNIYGCREDDNIVNRIDNERKELISVIKHDESNSGMINTMRKITMKRLMATERRKKRKKETERQWTDSEVTIQLMIGSLEEYSILLCSHKWGTTNCALNSVIRTIRQITREKSLSIEDIFPISLLNNENIFIVFTKTRFTWWSMNTWFSMSTVAHIVSGLHIGPPLGLIQGAQASMGDMVVEHDVVILCHVAEENKEQSTALAIMSCVEDNNQVQQVQHVVDR